MILRLLRDQLICRKFLTFCFLYLVLCIPTFAMQEVAVEYNDVYVDYSVLNPQQVLKEADNYFAQYQKSNETKYLTTALGKYYIYTKMKPVDIYSNVQLARGYGILKCNRYAKKYFNIAADINKFDPYLNYHCGEFYFVHADYKRALKFYKIAYKNGYEKNYDLNIRIATIYEKFADLKNAIYYYERANSLKSSGSISTKIQNLKSLDYDKSNYYKAIKNENH